MINIKEGVSRRIFRYVYVLGLNSPAVPSLGTLEATMLMGGLFGRSVGAMCHAMGLTESLSGETQLGLVMRQRKYIKRFQTWFGEAKKTSVA